MSGTLYIVATPIGNLQDVTSRALETLGSVDYILAEDTRVTLKLLQHYGISKKLISYSEHSSQTKEDIILSELQDGKSYALVSDAGTPAVSDPGARLVDMAVKNDIAVVPIVGASAVSAIVSVFGKPETFYHFWGFFPQKNKKRKQLLTHFKDIPGIHVFFESPFRIVKTLEECFVDESGFHVVIGRELTKQFESIYRGNPKEVLEQLQQDPVKGEFVVALCFERPEDNDDDAS